MCKTAVMEKSFLINLIVNSIDIFKFVKFLHEEKIFWSIFATNVSYFLYCEVILEHDFRITIELNISFLFKNV